jgi:uncharacterized membrane protein YfcA
MHFIFFLIALFYSMVGFGGGSSYVALMALYEVPYTSIPALAQSCNIIVVMGGCYHFFKGGHHSWKLSRPFLLSSAPMSFLGAQVHISKEVFLFFLALSLIAVGFRLLFFQKIQNYEETKPPQDLASFCIGSVLGFVSGMIGMGGGIFLAPILLLLRWGKPKEVAATASVFILINSLTGLAGQIFKLTDYNEILSYWPIWLSVFVGGQIGSRLGSSKIPQNWISRATACLAIFVGSRILSNFLAI